MYLSIIIPLNNKYFDYVQFVLFMTVFYGINYHRNDQCGFIIVIHVSLYLKTKKLIGFGNGNKVFYRNKNV